MTKTLTMADLTQSAADAVTAGTDDLAPVADDFSAYIIAGAVSSDASMFERETEGRTPAQGVQDGVDAERLGFRRVLISERWDLKEADVILAAIGARTSRLELVTGIVVPTTRHPWMQAALGATMQSCFGPRFVLGLGRGDVGVFRGMGIDVTTLTAMAKSAKITRQLWAGESVSYHGQLGSFDALAFAETYQGTPPPIWIAGFCHERGAAVAAEAYDGVILPPMLTPEATAAAVARIRRACERIDRDPAEIRIVQPVITAPDMDEVETSSISAGRLVTYLQYPYYGDTLAKANGWDLEIVTKMRNHEQFQNLSRAADLTFHRHQMLGPASVLPWSWIQDCCAVGSVDECVTSLQRFRDAGADEVTTYGSTPRQNAALIAAWRNRPAAVPRSGAVTQIVDTLDQLTPEWFTSALRAGGTIATNGAVESVDVKLIGSGQLGLVALANLGYVGAADDAPPSLVVKLPSAEDSARELGAMMGVYEAEVRFYQQILPLVSAAVPKMHWGDVDPATGRFTLVLEDLSATSTAGDMVAGGTIEQARLALAEIVGIQAPLWDDPMLRDQAWLGINRSKLFIEQTKHLLTPFLERFEPLIDPAYAELARKLVPIADRYIDEVWIPPFVVAHGDYRLDNMMFGSVDTAPPISIIDWQGARLAPPLLDAAIYLSSCLSVPERRAHETDLIREYHKHLIAAGVADFSIDDCWQSYRLCSLYPFFIAIAAATVLAQTDRGNQMLAQLINGCAQLVIDTRAEEFLQ